MTNPTGGTATPYESLLRFLYTCPVGLISFADSGAIELINPKAVNLLAPALDVTEFSNVYDVFRPSWPGLESIVRNAPALSGHLVDEHQLSYHEHPIQRWLSVSAIRVGPNQNMLSISDVTASVETRLAADDIERFNQRVLNNLFSFVGVLLPDGTLTWANNAPLEAANIEADEVFGKKFWDCFWWNHSADVQAKLRDSIERAALGEAVRHDMLVRVADDQRMWIDFQVAPLRNSAGMITHLIPSGQDINDRKRAEHESAEALKKEQSVRERIELLERTATHLMAATTVEELADSILNDIRASLDLDIASLNIIQHGLVRRIASTSANRVGLDPDFLSDLNANLPAQAAIRENAVLIFNDFAEIGDRFPELTPFIRDLPVESIGVFPVRNRKGIAHAAIVVAAPTAHWFRDEGVVSLLRGIAGQTGQALDRARLFEEVLESREKEHAISLRLQEALLPDHIVEHPNLEMSAQYRAAGEFLAVGGDWYDTFSWPDGQIAVMVGDVVGHDLDASITMGRLRSAVAALAPLNQPSAAALIKILDDCVRGDIGTDFVTATCVIIDPSSGRVSYCNAGHPPPLVVECDGSTMWLDGAVTAPVSRFIKSERIDTTIDIAPESTLLLYSDGLVERRGESIQAGLDRLADAAISLRAEVPEKLTHDLIEEIVDGIEAVDDAILVAIRWHPGDAPVSGA